MLVTCYSEDEEDKVVWAQRALSGRGLIPEKTNIAEIKQEPLAILTKINPNIDKIVPYYMPEHGAVTWATVTPVVLPGYDDPAHLRRRLKNTTAAEEQIHLLERLNERIDGLIRKAIVQAGFSQSLADHAEIEWRKVGFWPGTEHADRYGIPDHLKRFPRYHIKIGWYDSKGESVLISGPVCIGGGRYYGLGLFASIHEDAFRPGSVRT